MTGGSGALRRIAIAIALAMAGFASLAGQDQRGAAVRKPVAMTSWKAPMTPDGQPDLQGTWANYSATPLERPDALAGKATLTDQELADLKNRAARMFNDSRSDFAPGDNVFLAALGNAEQYKNPNRTIENALDMETRDFGDNRTSLVVTPADGKIPFTPDGRKRQAAALNARLYPAPSDPENLLNDLRCITFGVPRLGGNAAGYNSYYQITQTRDFVVLLSEVIHDARVIPTDGRPHLPSSVRLWNGDPRGRWEGQTLVIDTTNFSRKSFFQGSSENLHLVERLTRVAGDTINYEITASDPDTWTQPWTAVVRLKRSSNGVFEYACHEGNRQIMIGMLAGAQAASSNPQIP